VFPITTVNTMIVIAMLMAIPISRIVSIMPEARPNTSFCTELIQVRTGGDWQNATPAPGMVTTNSILHVG